MDSIKPCGLDHFGHRSTVGILWRYGSVARSRQTSEVSTRSANADVETYFKPNADLSNLGRTVPYYSEAHADAGVAFADMTAEQKKLYYPEGGPQHGDQIIVLQAHAGGLDAGKVEGAVKVRSDRLQWASPEWHRKLGEEVDQPIADNIASNSDGTAIKTAILGFYRDTIWRGALPLEATGGRRFDLYFTSTDSQWRSYDSLKSYASAAFTSAETELVSDMDKVF